MKFSTTTRYGLRAIIYIARKDGIASVREISTAEDVPIPYLEKIISRLSKAGLIAASRGAAGGYSLVRPAAEITVDDVVRVLEKTTSPAPCIEHGYECPRKKECPTRGIWEKIDQSIHATLETITLASLID